MALQKCGWYVWQQRIETWSNLTLNLDLLSEHSRQLRWRVQHSVWIKREKQFLFRFTVFAIFKQYNVRTTQPITVECYAVQLVNLPLSFIYYNNFCC